MKPSLSEDLKSRLKGASKIAVLGVGSDLRSDDVAGVLVARKVGNRRKAGKSPAIRSFCGGAAPENFAGAVVKFGPSHLVVVDAADLGLKPGKTALIAPEKIGGASFSTHMLPLSLTLDYIRQSIPCAVAVIGIQPRSTAFGEEVSPPVLAAVGAVASAILRSV